MMLRQNEYLESLGPYDSALHYKTLNKTENNTSIVANFLPYFFIIKDHIFSVTILKLTFRSYILKKYTDVERSIRVSLGIFSTRFGLKGSECNKVIK